MKKTQKSATSHKDSVHSRAQTTTNVNTATISASAQAAKLFREKGEAALPELMKLKKRYPRLDLDGILHKAKQNTITASGKRCKEISKTISSPLIPTSQREALADFLKKSRDQPHVPSEALSVLAAAMSNNTKYVKSHFAILQDLPDTIKAKANATDRLGRTPLFYSVFHGNEELCEFLVEAGTDISKVDETGRTVLHYAAMKENPKLIEYLYKCWKNPKVFEKVEGVFEGKGNIETEMEEKIPMGKTLAEVLADMNEIDLIYESVAAGKYGEVTDIKKPGIFSMIGAQNVVNKQDKMGRTALHIAAFYCHKGNVEMLIKLGADVNCEDNLKMRPVDVTINEGIQEFLSLKMKAQKNIQSGLFQGLVKTFAKTNVEAKPNSLDLRDLELLPIEKLLTEKHSFERDSYLMLSIKYSNKTAFDYLLAKGFDLLYKNASGYTVLHLIVKQGLGAFLQTLCESSGKNLMNVYTALDIQTNKGLTPLHIAIENNNTPMVMYLLDLLEKRNTLAALKNGFKSLKQNLDIACQSKETALLKAVKLKNPQLAKVLIEKGADVYLVNKEKRNVLHLAVMNRMKEFIEFLIYYDTDKNELREAKDCKGRTAKDMDSQHLFGQLFTHVWDYCKNNENARAIRVLLERDKGLVNRKTRTKGSTPLHVAVANNADEIVQVLVDEYGADTTIKNATGETPMDLVKKKKLTDKKKRIMKILGQEVFEINKENIKGNRKGLKIDA